MEDEFISRGKFRRQNKRKKGGGSVGEGRGKLMGAERGRGVERDLSLSGGGEEKKSVPYDEKNNVRRVKGKGPTKTTSEYPKERKPPNHSKGDGSQQSGV